MDTILSMNLMAGEFFIISVWLSLVVSTTSKNSFMLCQKKEDIKR